MIEYLGWSATAVFVGSYFCARAEMLKRLQMAGALMWVAYGLLIGASPVVIANVLVFAAAAVGDGLLEKVSKRAATAKAAFLTRGRDRSILPD